MNSDTVEQRIEEFIRTQFSVSLGDPWFDREADLFKQGYVDSMGVVEVLEFLQKDFNVEIPDDDLLTDDFSNIAGITRIVLQNLKLQPLAKDGSVT
jgi:acyl carrier protein